MLYNKHRPNTEKELIGQPHAFNFLSNLSEENIPNSVILAGESGLGKTTTARLIGKKIYELDSIDDLQKTMDWLEYDAASFSGVADVRELKSRLNLSTMSGKPRLIYIDEAHNLSKQAFDVLLKITEEPGNNCFVFSTTALNKIPDTIQTRSVVINFTKPTQDDLLVLLREVAKKEGYSVDLETLGLLSFHSTPSYRDALVVLESLLTSFGLDKVITKTKVDDKGLLLSQSQRDAIKEFPAILKTKNWLSLLKLIQELENEEKPLRNFSYYMYNYTRKLVLNGHDNKMEYIYLLESISSLLSSYTLTKIQLENLVYKLMLKKAY